MKNTSKSVSAVSVLALGFLPLHAQAAEQQIETMSAPSWSYGADELVMKVRDEDGLGICLPLTDGTDWGSDLEISMVPIDASAADFKTVSYDGSTLAASDWTNSRSSLLNTSASAGDEFIVQITPASGDPNVNYGWLPVGFAKPDGCDDGSIVEVIQWGSFIKDWELAFRGENQLTTVPNSTPPNLSSTVAMFINAGNFNSPIDNWDFSTVTDTSKMFRNAISFNQDLNSWDVGNVTTMTTMFRGASAFDGDIGDWDVSSVTDFRAFLRDASSFNKNLNNWQIGAVSTMQSMFHGALEFNGDITSWDVSQVGSFINTFTDTDTFDQDLSDWDVASATTFEGMFDDATAFSHYLGDWNISSSADKENMFRDTPSYNYCFPDEFLNKVDGGVEKLGKPANYEDSCRLFNPPQFSAPTPFEGPVVTSITDSVAPGGKVSVKGSGLDSVTSVLIQDIEVEVNLDNSNEVEFVVPQEKKPGDYSLKLLTPTTTVTLSKNLAVESAPTSESDSLKVWTKKVSDNQVKFYAQSPENQGKVQFFVNGSEIAWIRAEDSSDPKLRTIDDGPMAGTSYLVRTVELQQGKNALEIYQDGERVWRAAYTG